MSVKLIKYEIKAMGRIMLPLYAVMMFAACLFAVSMKMNLSGPVRVLLERFALITGFLFGAAILAVGVVMVMCFSSLRFRLLSVFFSFMEKEYSLIGLRMKSVACTS